MCCHWELYIISKELNYFGDHLYFDMQVIGHRSRMIKNGESYEEKVPAT